MRSGPSGSSSTMEPSSTVTGQRDQGHHRRRVERLPADEVEARQVQRAGDRITRQEALVQLEVLVGTDALERMQTVPVDEQDVRPVHLDHEHRALGHGLDGCDGDAPTHDGRVTVTVRVRSRRASPGCDTSPT